MTAMHDSADEVSVASGTSFDKVKQLVQNINIRHAAFQRHATHSTLSSPDLRDGVQFNTHERSPVDQKPPFNREGSTWSQHTHTSLRGSDIQTPLSRTSSRSRNKERELFFAASDLCQYLNGGVNYRAMCLQYQRAIELLIVLFREDILMLRELDVVPIGTIDKIHTIFSSILQETKDILVENKLISPSAAVIKKKSSLGKTSSMSHSLPVPLPIPCGRNGSPLCSSPHLLVPTPRTQVKKIRKCQTNECKGNVKETRVPLDFVSPLCNSDNTKDGLQSTVNSVVLDASTDTDSHDTRSSVLKRQSPHQLRHEKSTPSVHIITDDTNEALNDNTMDGTNAKGNKSRSKLLEKLYKEQYPYEGLEMMTAIMRLTFENEYKNSEGNARENFAHFKDRFDERVLPCSWNYESFETYTKDCKSLRSEYVEHCLRNNVKPNNNILAQLGSILSEREITTLCVTKTPLCDNDIQPLVAILPRLENLRFLNLGHDTLHDDSVSKICAALSNHPTLEVFDLSGNPITDVAGRELLRLAESVQSLRSTGQLSLCLSKPVQEALNKQLRVNEQNCDAAWAAAQELLQTFGGQRMTAGKELHTVPRLAPLGPEARKLLHSETSTIESVDLSLNNSKTERVIKRLDKPKVHSYVPRHIELPTTVRLPYLTAGRGTWMGS